MEFLLAIAPVVGIFVIVLLALLIVFIMSKIFKYDVKLPYGKIILATLVLTTIVSGYKVFTSPITRPTVNEAVNDTARYEVDPMIKLEAPKANDNSFKSEEVDVTTLKSEDKIKEHAANSVTN